VFPRDARFDYKLFLDGRLWDLDPLNPLKQVGGYGPNSELRMPDWKFPENVVRRENIPHGTLSKDIPFKSAQLGYVINYRVYTPPGFDTALSKNLPVLYASDGSDYWNDQMGGLVTTLDNLIADGRIVPMLAVFIDPWDQKEGVNRRQAELVPAQDRRCAFCEFMVDELIPAIDSTYPTKASREGRAIIGASLGGLHATLMAMRYGRLFGMAGIQSPAFPPAPWVLDEIGDAEVLPAKAFIDVGVFEGGLTEGARVLRDKLKKRQVDVKYVEVNEGHSWGHWRAQLDDMLVYFFPSNVER
jgi:enterochelin esterase family protein